MAPQPPTPLSKEALEKFKPPIKQEPVDEKMPALVSANRAKLSLRTPKKAAEVNKPIHSLVWFNIKHEDLPGIGFCIMHNDDPNNRKKKWGNSYAEKVARDIKYGSDEYHEIYEAMGFHKKLYNLWIDGEVKTNTGKYPIKIFLILLGEPATDEQAYTTACQFADLINQKSGNKPHLSVPRSPSPYHPTEGLKWQHVLGNEQCLGLLADILEINPANIPNFGQVYDKYIEACFSPGSLCTASAAILSLGNEWVHLSYLSKQDQNLLQVAGIYNPEEQEDEGQPEDAEDHQEDGENGHLQEDAMEEDSLEEEEDGGDADGDDDEEDEDDDFGDQDSFIVQDGEEESDGSFHEH